jgi:hypothetical protein
MESFQETLFKKKEEDKKLSAGKKGGVLDDRHF